jgi:hypothetical protein
MEGRHRVTYISEMRRCTFWLNYLVDGESCAVVVEDIDPILARRQVEVAGVFVGVDRLDEESAGRIPASHRGRLLRQAELLELQRLVALPRKKPPARSMRRNKKAPAARATRAL